MIRYLTTVMYSSAKISQPSGLSSRGLLHNTFTGAKSQVKSENSGKHEFTIDFT